MKLLLMRHANTESAGSAKDSERKLTDHGKEEALRAAMFLRNFAIDKVLVSWVKRAMQTSDIITSQIKIPESETVTELYQENEQEAKNLILSQSNRYKNILVIGHNPLIYRLSLDFSNPDSRNHEELIHSGMPTAKVVVIDFQGASSWEHLKHTKGEITDIFIP